MKDGKPFPTVADSRKRADPAQRVIVPDSWKRWQHRSNLALGVTLYQQPHDRDNGGADREPSKEMTRRQNIAVPHDALEREGVPFEHGQCNHPVAM